MPAAGFLHRPRVSRETRRLLSAAALALIALWLLARLRFPETSVAPNPVPPLLAQLAPPARFSELAAEVNAVRGSVGDLLSVVTLSTTGPRSPHLVLQVRPGVAATIAPITNPGTPELASQVLAADLPTGLMFVAVDRREPVTLPQPWHPERLDAPQFLFAAVATSDHDIVWRPVFLSAESPAPSPAWQADVWRLGDGTTVTPGSLLFTASGELAGIAASDAGQLVLVPAEPFYAAVERLTSAPPLSSLGWMGVTVTGLTGPLTAVTGISRGVLVTEVDSRSAAATYLNPGEVITTVNGMAVDTVAEWLAIAGRVQVGDVVRMRAEDVHAGRDLEVTAVAFPSPGTEFGARLRRIAGSTEIVSIQPGTSAARAGLAAGDLIVRAGTTDDPTPAQIERELHARTESSLLVLFLRDGTTHATAVTP